VHVSAGAAAADERATPDQRADAAQHSSKLSDLSGDHFDQHDRQAVKCRLVPRLQQLSDSVHLKPHVA